MTETTDQTSNDTCFNPTEADERAHAARVTAKIGDALQYLSQEVAARHTEMIKLKAFLHEHKGDMDHAEKITVRLAVDQIVAIGKHGEAQRKRLVKLFRSPYFGRVDVRNGHAHAQPVYIGIHSFHDGAGGTPLVHDWRAPISSLFYDFETGDAFYDTPEGRVDCRLERKRQYKVEKGQLVFMLETSLNIHDDVLQRELSRASDDKMKNIVATIQRDQNVIIRDESASALIIQGAAGSGKTSIALHRIAFLLYRLKDTIRSSDILIISPNKVFAHYISQVLPELGEEMIRETTMEALATQLLGEDVKFQTFAEQVAALLRAGDKSGDRKYAERIQFKATPAFLEQLDEYGRAISNRKVRAKDLTFGKHTVPADRIAARFQACGPMPFAQQLNEVTEAVVDHLRTRHEMAITGKQRATLRTQLKKMMGNTDLHALYENCFVWLNRPDLLHRAKGGEYEYADVFPLIHLKLQLEGATPHHHIKHLVVDEMQDYTPVQYRVLARLFPCKKTILGDYNQSVNPLSSSSAEAIKEILPEARCMFMNKSYRSTIEITELAQRINRNPHLEPIERHGDRPEIIACKDMGHEREQTRLAVKNFLASDHHSLGIICKTQDQADALHEHLRNVSDKIHLLNARSTVFRSGIIIATAHLAKGLEFDQVIVPHCTAENYGTVIDRQMLYVACTRAMHRLHLFHVGQPSQFLAGTASPAGVTSASAN